MKLKDMFELTFWRKWVGFQFTPYTYDGKDGRRVVDWMMYFGFFSLTKYCNKNYRRT